MFQLVNGYTFTVVGAGFVREYTGHPVIVSVHHGRR